MRTLLLLAIAALLVWGVRSMMGGGAPASIDPAFRQAVLDALNEDIATNSPVCRYDGPFPMDSDQLCVHCDKLEDAGLISRQPNPERPGTASRPIEKRVLTRSGREVYVDSPVTDGGTPRPRFCFGEARLDGIVAALPVFNFSGSRYLAFKYRVRVEQPHPWLKGSEAELLDLPRLDEQGALLAKTFRTAANIGMDGKVIEFDPGFTYGPWANETP